MKIVEIINYIVFITLIVLISSCENEKKRIKQQGEACYNDTVMQFSSDTLSFLFVNIQNVEQMEIYHIRGGQKEMLPYGGQKKVFLKSKRDFESNNFRIKNPNRLYTHDTIRLVLNGKAIYDISNFRKGADFGGPQYRYLGCSLHQCIVNGKKYSFMDGNILPLGGRD